MQAVVAWRYGGLLVVTIPCGRVVAMVSLAGGESLAQAYALISTLVSSRRDIKYVFCDHACALGRYVRHTSRMNRTEVAQQMADMKYVLDGLHVDNHACVNPVRPLHMPE